MLLETRENLYRATYGQTRVLELTDTPDIIQP